MQTRFLTFVTVFLLSGTVLVSLSALGATPGQIGTFFWLIFLVLVIGSFVLNQIRQRPDRSH